MRWFVWVWTVMLCLGITGCELEGSSGGDGDSGGNATASVVSLQSYSDINHAFMSETLSALHSSATSSQPGILRTAEVQGEVAQIKKIVGTVAQIAGKVITHTDKVNFQNNVLGDLTEIKTELYDLDTKVTQGFKQIYQEIKDTQFQLAWSTISSPYLANIDTAWHLYLRPDTETGLLDKLAKMDSNGTTSANVEAEVTSFISDFEKLDCEKNLTTAIEAIDADISNTGSGGYYPILSLYVDYLTSSNGNEFTDPEVMDSVLSQYLYLYKDLVNYQMKATILLDEYHNYQLLSDTSVSADIVLSDEGYTTQQSNASIAQNNILHADLKKGLGEFINNGERLISQYNAGDIYRNYNSTSTAIRNSDYYPFIDAYIQTFYGYDNLFVFRLAWSEEAATNDPDAWLAGEEVTGMDDYPYDYTSLFDGLKDSWQALDFFITDVNGSQINPVTDDDYEDSLSTISIFSLSPQGTDFAKEFQAGVRRYVFPNMTSEGALTLAFDADQTPLDESYTFKYSQGSDNDVYEKEFDLYDPGSMQFTLGGLLEDNNPLNSTNFNGTNCVSYTFGAYMTGSEYIADQNRMPNGLRSLYGPFTSKRYEVEASTGLNKQNIEIDNHETSGFRFEWETSGAEDHIYDGVEAKVFISYLSMGWYPQNGYMWQKNHKDGKPIEYKDATLDANSALLFTVKKKYIFPSGKLFSNDEIKEFNYFMLTVSNKHYVHCMVEKHDYRLEFKENSPYSMKSWFFMDSTIPDLSE